MSFIRSSVEILNFVTEMGNCLCFYVDNEEEEDQMISRSQPSQVKINMPQNFTA